MFNSIRFVLVATSHPGNIGSTARAMKTMGFERLYLVSPKSFPDSTATALAAGADDVLHHAVLTATLSEALVGCRWVIATSARARDLALPELTPSSCAKLIAKDGLHEEIAIVFGREQTGLTNEELLYCHYQVHIPSNPTYCSLNLAQAVQILAYELRMKLIQVSESVPKAHRLSAVSEDVEHFYAHLEEVLVEIDFLKPSNPKKLMQRLRRLFNRTKLEHTEVQILRGILTHVQLALQSAKGTL